MSEDHTKVKIQTNVRQDIDPTIQRMVGMTNHKSMEFDVPYMTQVEGNLWQGGSDPKLQLPHFIKHYISVAPWYNYTIKHELKSALSVVMYDDLGQTLEQIDALAHWINVCVADAPTLVHCQAGLNRSSLVVVRSLMLRDDNPMTADDAIKMLRENRSPAVLCNQTFEDHLRSL